MDAALQRPPHFKLSSNVMFLVETRRFSGYVSASTVSDLCYILRKDFGHEKSLDALRRLVTICDVVNVDRSVIEKALVSDFKDFEDAVQNYTAVAAGLHAIVTRNVKDFVHSDLQVMTPEQLLQTLNESL